VLPHCDLVYAADNAMFPYGVMEDDQLISRVLEVMGHLIEKFTPDVAVIACNTASTLALEALRARFGTTFVGVVPAIKPAAKTSSTSVIGLLATPATVEREYTNNLVKDFADHCLVVRVGSSKLVEYAENEIAGNPASNEELEAELQKLLTTTNQTPMDTVVLACTHFPLLKERFNKLNGWRNVQWVDSGSAIARRVKFHLEEAGKLKPAQLRPQPSLMLYFTDTDTHPSIAKCYQQHLIADNIFGTISAHTGAAKN